MATRYSNGNVAVEYHDGSKMCVLSQTEGGGITMQQANGMMSYYTPADDLPQVVRERLAEIPGIVKQLVRGTQVSDMGASGGGGGGGGYGTNPPMRYASTGLVSTNGKQMNPVNAYGSVSNMRLHHMR